MSIIQDGIGSVKRLIALFREAGHSPTREALLGLTDEFAAAVMQNAPEAADDPQYSIYVGQKEVGAGGVHHTFVRLVGPDSRIACDIHGLRWGRLFNKEIDAARAAADRNNIGNAAWLDRFMTALQAQRAQVDTSLQALRRGAGINPQF